MWGNRDKEQTRVWPLCARTLNDIRVMWFLPSPSAEWVLRGEVMWLTCGTSHGPSWEWWQTLVSVIYCKMGRCSFLLFSFITLFSLINEGCAIAEHRQEDWKSKLAPWLAACRDFAVTIQGGSRGRAEQLLSFSPRSYFWGFLSFLPRQE